MPAAATATARRWAELLDLHDASGLTARTFAAQHDVNHRTLAWWRSQLGRARTTTRRAPGREGLPSAAPAFLELRVAAPALHISLGRGDAHIAVDHDTDLDLLRKVLAALC